MRHTNILLSHCRLASAEFSSGIDNPGRITHDSATIWHVHQDDRHRTDSGTIADTYAPQQLSIGANINVIANQGDRSVSNPIADGNALAQSAITADDHTGVDKNVAKMVDTQTTTNLRVVRQTYASQSFDQPKT